jgi:hypothetical protein
MWVRKVESGLGGRGNVVSRVMVGGVWCQRIQKGSIKTDTGTTPGNYLNCEQFWHGMDGCVYAVETCKRPMKIGFVGTITAVD